MTHNLDSLIVRPIKKHEKERWNHLIKEHHYLHSRRLVGESMRYVATLNDKWVALLGWTGASFKLADRDDWIGWCKKHKKQRRKYIANSARLLILPEIDIKNLASKALALNLKRLSDDWVQKYNHPIVLVETFIDPLRFHGICYRAANFIEIGETKGYGVSAGEYYYHGNKKMILVYPLQRKTRYLLTTPFLSPLFAQGSNNKPMVNLNRLNVFEKDGLIDYLDNVSNWRNDHGNKYHKKSTVLSLAVCAILAGHGGSYREISRWVQALPKKVAKRFGCSHTHNYETPGRSTLVRSLQGVNGKEVAQKVTRWLKEQGQKRAIPKVCKKIHHFCQLKTQREQFISTIMGVELS